MSSTSKTANLQLNQWQRADFVNMDDFNADNAAIDAAIGALPLVKLFDQTLAADVNSLSVAFSDFAVSDFAVARYAKLAIYAQGTRPSDTLLFRVNSRATGYGFIDNYGGSNGGEPGGFCLNQGYGELILTGGELRVVNMSYSFQKISLAPSALTSLSFLYNNSLPILTGTRVVIIGYKL